MKRQSMSPALAGAPSGTKTPPASCLAIVQRAMAESRGIFIIWNNMTISAPRPPGSDQVIRNIIFDWSGTLADDFQCTYLTNMAVFQRLGLRSLSAEQFRKEFSLPYMEFYRNYTGVSKEEIDRIFAEEFQSPPPQELYPGVKDTLAGLRQSGVRLAILSTCVKSKLLEEMECSGIGGFFVDVRGGVYDKAEELPDILKANGFSQAETAFVGDMTHDIESGKKAGVISVAITWGYQTREKLEGCKPTHVISRLAEVVELVNRGRGSGVGNPPQR